MRAYQLVGFTPGRDLRYIEINRTLRALHEEIVSAAVQQINGLGSAVSQDPASALLSVNGEFTVSICVARCHATAAGTLRWQIRFDTSLNPDVVVAVRMDCENQAVQDYFVFPRTELPGPQALLGEHNGLALDSFRFETLDQFYEMAAHVPVESVR